MKTLVTSYAILNNCLEVLLWAFGQLSQGGLLIGAFALGAALPQTAHADDSNVFFSFSLGTPAPVIAPVIVEPIPVYQPAYYAVPEHHHHHYFRHHDHDHHHGHRWHHVDYDRDHDDDDDD
ncbi:MAG: hypothetical protein ACT4NU_02700 [Chromatiales bacterium]